MLEIMRRKENASSDKGRMLAAIAASVILLAFVLCSTFFLATEASHHCNEEDCPICICIEKCEVALLTMACISIAICVFCILRDLRARKFCSNLFFLEEDTPVLLRVRLNP